MFALCTRPRNALLLSVCALLIESGAAPLCAQDTATWLGGAGLWWDAGMWSTGQVPYAETSVFIDGGQTEIASEVLIDSGARCDSLTLDANDVLRVASILWIGGPDPPIFSNGG